MNGTLLSSTGKINRQELQLIATPAATSTHRPIPHHEIVQALVETLGSRHIGVVRDEYAVSSDGMRMFGVLDLETGVHGCRFSIGIRNGNDRSLRLAMTVGYRVTVCDNMAFHGDFTPVEKAEALGKESADRGDRCCRRAAAGLGSTFFALCGLFPKAARRLLLALPQPGNSAMPRARVC